MKTIFEKGDKVFDIRFGWGVVIFMYSFDWNKEDDSKLICVVEFKNEGEIHYTKEIALKLLSFTEYTLEGFNQEKQINWDDYIGKWCIFSEYPEDNEDFILIGKLISVNKNGRFHSGRCNFAICEPLTEEQIKILNLE